MNNDIITIINENYSEEVTSVIIDDEIIQIDYIDDQLDMIEPDNSEPITIIDNLKEIPVHTGIQGIPIEEKGMPNGVASLDNNGKIPVEQLPDLDININEIEYDVKQWIDAAIEDKANKNDLDKFLIAEDLSESIDPIKDNVQLINDQLLGIDLLLNDILGN